MFFVIFEVQTNLIMKNLFYLFLALFVFACSSDDSSDESNNSNQTFFEKYDGIVWEEQTTEDFLNRIQINNGNIISIKFYFVEEGDEYCNSNTFLNSDLIEVNTNSFSFNEQEENDGEIESWVVTVTASNNGNNLTIEYSDDPDYPEIFSRTSLTDPCN